MALRLTAPSEDILGANYKITKIVASDYNPNIDSTITVTVTVKDVYDDPVENESVQVTCNIGKFTKLNNTTITASSSVTGTTNSNGQFTLTYSCTEWGLITFSAKNHIHLQIRVTGYSQISSSNITNYTIYQKENHIRVVFNYPTQSLTTTWSTLTSAAIGDKTKRPSTPIVGVGHYGNYLIRINAGTFESRTISGTANTAIIGIIEYDI